MTNVYTFLRIYKSLARNELFNDEALLELYWDLKDKVQTPDDKWFQKQVPDKLEMALAVDYVAHSIHAGGDEVLQKYFPGADYGFVKTALDELAGAERSNEVRRVNRGYFSPILSADGMVFLSKSQTQVGRTTKDAILPAIKEYERLFQAGLASPAEILTLHRYYPENQVYQQAVQEKGLHKEESEPVVVGGPASVEMIDREGHLITVNALRNSFGKFMQNFRARNINALHCLHPDTKIYVNDRGRFHYKPIKDIVVGDKVITHAGVFRPVLRVMHHTNDDGYLVQITLKNKEVILITSEHKILNNVGEWVEAKDFSVGNTVMAVHNGTEIVSVDQVPYAGDVYNLEVDEYPSYAGRGIIFHNSDVQVGWALPAYIARDGSIYASGVDEKQLWVLSELRNDSRVAERMKEEIKQGTIKSYSIAGSATSTENVSKGATSFMRVNDMELAEITLCLTPDSHVWTKRGLIPIENVTTNDEVFTDKNVWSRVVKIFKRDFSGDLIRVETNTGIITVTKEHPIFASISNRDVPPVGPGRFLNYEWVPAENIQNNDICLVTALVHTCKNCNTPEISNTYGFVRVARVVPYVGSVYNLEVEWDNSFATSACVVHNCNTGVNQGSNFSVMKSADALPSTDEILLHLHDSPLPVYGECGVYLEQTEHPRILIHAERSNALTDEITKTLEECLPPGTPVITSTEVGEAVPLYKFILVPIWGLVGDDEEEEQEDEKFRDDGYTTSTSEEETQLSNGGDSAFSRFQGWLGRQQKHEALVEDYGFPKEPEDPKTPVLDEKAEPWMVNQGGEPFTADPTTKQQARSAEHGN